MPDVRVGLRVSDPREPIDQTVLVADVDGVVHLPHHITHLTRRVEQTLRKVNEQIN